MLTRPDSSANTTANLHASGTRKPGFRDVPSAHPASLKSLRPVLEWFERQGWKPLPFQRQTWEAYLAGRSGLIQVPTGSGKTYAAVMGPIARMLQDTTAHKGIRLLYLTPLSCLLYTSPSPRD